MAGIQPTKAAWLSNQESANTAHFQTTLWTTVLAAGAQASSGSEAALARLCQIYWKPVYAYVRKRVFSPEQAQDLTQSFFARLLEKNYIARADRNRGRFRSFLMTSVENFLRDEHDRATSLKRGGGESPLSLDIALDEEANEPMVNLTPALAFEKRWVSTLLEEVMSRLKTEYAGNRSLLFEHLQAHLSGETDAVPYDQLAQQLGVSSVHLRVIAHRMRQRYREVLRAEIAQTVGAPAEIDSEISYLMQIASS
jgi:RNA polymerase sigma factor (sigma-70 family)